MRGDAKMYDENAIEVRNVQKKFAEKTAVQDISFTVKKEKYLVYWVQMELEKRHY